MTVAGLLLAAGGGRRFGGPKALVEHGDRLLVERGADLLADGGCRPVLVVVGAAAPTVLRQARLGAATAVVNPDWEEGIGSSVRAGLRALEPMAEVEATVIALCDQPRVSPEAVRRLVGAWRAGAAAAVASFDGRPRNPVVLDRSVWTEVAELAWGDVGARGFLRSHAESVTPVECGDVASPDDIDTADDLARLTPDRTDFRPD